MLNMCVAVVLRDFTDAKKEESNLLREEDFAASKEAWQL
jgi:hypothetical protein